MGAMDVAADSARVYRRRRLGCVEIVAGGADVMLDWTYYLALGALLLCGWVLTIVGLPGLWMMAAALAAYAWATGWDRYVGWSSLIAMVVLASAAEIVEFVAGAAGSRAA